MNDLIGNNYEPSNEQVNAKKWMKIIGVILVLLLILAIALIVLMYYIQDATLKITLDGKVNKKLQNILLIQEEKVYIPIREFAAYVGYESYSGDYKQYAEDTTKCYVQCAGEIASFTMNSDKMYKLLTAGEDYEYFTIDEPVKMVNNVLYTTIDGAEKAFNISFTYNKEKNQITIYTLPQLVTSYASKFQNSAIAGDKADFSNQKALLYNRLLVQNADGYYGVNDLKGNEILGTKYKNIKFVESTKEFIVTTAENKMGIMSYDATTKISPEYDQIKQIDKNAGLYLVKNNNKQGVVNNTGSIIIYLEYDQIGIDAKKYTSNNIKNQYLLYDNCIPVKKGDFWGIFDKNGREILKVEYEELGCSVGAGKGSQTTTNNILLIPEYEGIVVRKDNLYGIKDSKGEQLIPIALRSIYSTISGGEETYYMIYNEQVMNVITYIKTYVRPQNNLNSQNNQTNQNTTNNEENANNQNNEVNQNSQNNEVDQNTQSNEVSQNSETNQNNQNSQDNANTVSTGASVANSQTVNSQSQQSNSTENTVTDTN